MKALFARYGGHGVIIGKGKEGVIELPEDQSLDNMLDHHSVEILTNIRYVSSYEIFSEYMGAYPKLARNLVRIGTLSHTFMDVFLLHDVQVETTIYMGKDKYHNVCALFISTDFSHLNWILGDIEKTYDYLLTVWFRDREDGSLAWKLDHSNGFSAIVFFEQDEDFAFIDDYSYPTEDEE